MSGAALDMTLDDLIKSNKKSGTRGRGRAAGPGPARRVPNGSANRAAPYSTPKVGDLKRCMVHYDRGGRSKGMAEVVLSRRQDALAAVKKYNDVQLDGKPMKIELVGTNITTPAAGVLSADAFGDSNVVARSGQRKGGFGRTRGGSGGRGRGSGRGRSQGRGEKVSANDLDADLEKDHAEAMQTNE